MRGDSGKRFSASRNNDYVRSSCFTQRVRNFIGLEVDENWGQLLVILFPWLYVIAAALDHFAIENDQTSNDGIHGHADSGDTPNGPNGVDVDVEVTPLSRDKHIYGMQAVLAGDSTARLEERAFPGKWGRHDGSIDDSPRFATKTMRFVKALATHRSNE